MARRWWSLIIHHTAGSTSDTVASVTAAHKRRGFATIGYHFLVEIDAKGRGHLKRGRPDTMDGAHAGVAHWNKNALGLCVAGNYEENEMSEELYQDVRAAVERVIGLYGIAPSKIMGHREVKATACPGKHFPLERLKKELTK